MNIEQTEMSRMVAAIISAMVNKPVFVNAIKEKIGTAIDTEELMFDKVYYSCSEVEQKKFMKAFIEKPDKSKVFCYY